MLPAVRLQQNSSLQKFSKDLTCMLLSLSEWGILGFGASARMNSFIEVKQESDERVSKNRTDKEEVVDTGGNHTSCLRLQVLERLVLGPVVSAPGSWNLQSFLFGGRHQAWVLPAGKAAPSASILKTERTGRWPPSWKTGHCQHTVDR